LEHLKKLQGNVKFYQNKCHLGNAPDTRRLYAKPLMCGPSGWPASQTPCLVGPTLQPPRSFLGGDAFHEAVEWNLRPGVGAGHTPWPVGHVARPAGQHLANYRLNQVGNSPGTPTNTPC
jgi:hypothetical protein